MTSRAGLFSVLPGVEIVKLRLDGRRFGGVGGLIKSGDGGAELFFSLGITPTGAGVWPRRLVSDVVVLMPRFFRLRAFFAGVVGRCSSKKALGDESPELVSGLRDLKSATNEDAAADLAKGDSGEGPGDGSVTEDESMVEMVVVGELSEDAVELLSRLSVCIWKEEKVPLAVGPLEAGRTTLLPCASEVSWCPLVCSSPPKTEPNEGIGMKDRALV
jgi:hypothetical protein